jgi:hypothetical protein
MQNPQVARPAAGRGTPPTRVLALARALDRGHGSPLSTVGALARRPATAVQAAGYLARLPTVVLRLSDAPPGRAIRSLLAVRTLRLLPTGRLAQAVLPLDGDSTASLGGRHRQALRTNVRRAHDLGFAAHRVPDLDCFIDLVREIGLRRGDDTADPASAPEVDAEIHQGYVVTDPCGTPEAYLLLAVDTHVGWTLASVGARPGNGAALCHYLLHAAAVRDLVHAKVGHLVADGALSVPDGVGYLQRRLGYRVCNVRIA